ncbi:hypothetical protein CSPX01_00204 [Colletotrichum filicis]|nr:hypothetical protein CSPX01_00204 [Colletotrichum filicis]
MANNGRAQQMRWKAQATLTPENSAGNYLGEPLGEWNPRTPSSYQFPPRSTLSHATLAQPTPNDSKTVTGAFRLPVLTLP